MPLWWSELMTGDTGVIEATGLIKRYGDLTAVNGVSLSVPEGSFFGIIGPNGAGKTTLLEMIEGIREPDEGEATIFGEKVWPRNPKLLPRMGVQLQASAFFERLTVEDPHRGSLRRSGPTPIHRLLPRARPRGPLPR